MISKQKSAVAFADSALVRRAWQKSSVRQKNNRRTTLEHHTPFDLPLFYRSFISQWLIASGRPSLCSNAYETRPQKVFQACSGSRHGPSNRPRWPAKRPKPRPRASLSINRLIRNWFRALDWNENFCDRVLLPLDRVDVVPHCRTLPTFRLSSCPINVFRKHGSFCSRIGWRNWGKSKRFRRRLPGWRPFPRSRPEESKCRTRGWVV